ncbi:hypothetical protein M378DRAFT_42176, partial [Amanita muscaria Koide BX008]
INRSALHTYYSALPFSPTDSLLYRRYIREAEHNMCCIEGGPKNPAQEAAAVTAIALSRDCSRLACGFVDGTVELWETSPTKRRISSHQCGRISDVEFGPDGRLFASGSIDGTINLWNGGDGS